MSKKSTAEQRGDAVRQLDKLGRVTVPNAAAILNKHPYTLREWINNGKIQTLPIGSRHWITVEEIHRKLDELDTSEQ